LDYRSKFSEDSVDKVNVCMSRYNIIPINDT